MSESPEELAKRLADYVAQHRTRYLATRGANGHIEDFRLDELSRWLPTLLLETRGRRSGRSLIVPLIYGYYAGEWVIVASKGGTPQHPAWFLNLSEQPEIRFQVAAQCFRAAWRVAEGEERARVWDYMVRIFPPYADYQKRATARVIPVVMLRPLASVPVFDPEPARS